MSCVGLAAVVLLMAADQVLANFANARSLNMRGSVFRSPGALESQHLPALGIPEGLDLVRSHLLGGHPFTGFLVAFLCFLVTFWCFLVASGASWWVLVLLDSFLVASGAS